MRKINNDINDAEDNEVSSPEIIEHESEKKTIHISLQHIALNQTNSMKSTTIAMKQIVMEE